MKEYRVQKWWCSNCGKEFTRLQDRFAPMWTLTADQLWVLGHPDGSGCKHRVHEKSWVTKCPEDGCIMVTDDIEVG